jgi:phospholipid transport system substrate-binding protein
MIKRWFAGAWLMAWLAGGLAWGAAQSPQELVKQTTDQMLSKLRDEHQVIDQHPERIYELVNQIVLPHFDFERMSSLVLGKHWRTASPDQRQRFVEQFRNLLVRTYAKSLSSYTDNKVNFLPFRGGPDQDDVTVRTEVEQPGGFPIPIDYSLYLDKGGEWKVYDVVVDGVSLVTNYRTTFANQIRQESLDKLIAALATRNQQGTEETPPGAPAAGKRRGSAE